MSGDNVLTSKEARKQKKLVGSRKNQLAQKKRAIEIKYKYLITNEVKQVFYQSREWRILKNWTNENFPRVCSFCGSKNEIHLDHVRPISTNPKRALDYRNVQFLCKDCNLKKSNTGTKRFGCFNSKKLHKPDEILNLRFYWHKFFKKIGKDGKPREVNIKALIGNVSKIRDSHISPSS